MTFPRSGNGGGLGSSGVLGFRVLRIKAASLSSSCSISPEELSPVTSWGSRLAQPLRRFPMSGHGVLLDSGSEEHDEI